MLKKHIWEPVRRVLSVELLLKAKRLTAILPNRCLMCHQSVERYSSGVCRYCLSHCLYQTPICLGCGKSMIVNQAYCGQCLALSPVKVIAPCSYHRGLGPWVAALKYQAQFAVLPPLTKALVGKIQSLEQDNLIRLPQVLVPVPLHPKRLKQRGFNQAAVIAKELSQVLQLPVDNQFLSRIVNTPPQAGLTGKQRRRNIQSAFSLAEPFPFQRIALVDDVVTTGTTISEISKLFERQHVDVQVWCLARAEAPHINV